MEKIKKYFEDKAKLIDAYILNSLQESESETLKEAVTYSIKAGGKRIRPILAIAVWELMVRINNNRLGLEVEINEEDYKQILPLAAALEMIHTYSLIHDDLPAMDNDDFRRGLATNHKVFGEAMAILAGDSLLSESFTVLSKLAKYYEPKKVLKLFEYISGCIGMKGILGGQALDIANVNFNEVDKDYLIKVNKAKTGALIRASVVCPAIIMGRDEDIEVLEIFGDAIGFAFQLMDDVLGASSTKEVLGKTPKLDAKNFKITFVELLGLERTKILANEEVKKAKEVLIAYDGFAETLIEIADLVANRIN